MFDITWICRECGKEFEPYMTRRQYEDITCPLSNKCPYCGTYNVEDDFEYTQRQGRFIDENN